MNRRKNVIDFIKTHSYAWVLVYHVFYAVCFYALEAFVVPKYYISSVLDSFIPFSEFFVIPYIFWFAYVPASIAFFLIRCSREDFLRLCFMISVGLTACLVIYALFPNGHFLRCYYLVDDNRNICAQMVNIIYHNDTSTNVCPSIHTFNSIILAIAFCKSETEFKYKKFVKSASIVLAVVISMSTVFIKQHSIVDVFYAVVLSVVIYGLTYHVNWDFAKKKSRAQA